MPDPRLKIGAVVHRKATPRILNHAEAHRIYGNRADVAVVQGMVEEVRFRESNGRRYKHLFCVWSIRGRKKRVEIPLGQAKLGPVMSCPNGISEREQEVSHPISQATSDDGNNQEQNSTPQGGNSAVQNQQQNQSSRGSSDIIVHGQSWKRQECEFPINGQTQRISWAVRTATGTVIQEGGAPQFMSPIDYFYAMLPMRHLGLMVLWTNEALQKHSLQLTTAGEILKFFGLLINMTRFKFSSRRELWHTESQYKYIPAADFGRIMSYKRFDDLRRFLCFTTRSREQPESTSSAQRWALCEDFLCAINEHRQERVSPSDLLCVDESMSRWYGRGGEWISVGLPHYVAMDRKPEAGCEIQDVACGRSGIMIGLSFVKSATDTVVPARLAGTNQGTRVLMKLCAPWMGSGRIVCGDSFFASVEAAALLFKNGLRFTGVIKNSTKKFPMEYLGNLEMDGRGSHVSLMSKFKTAGDMDYSMVAVGWVDRNRRYFVSTAGTTLPGNIQERIRLRELENGSGAARVQVSVAIPAVIETYYSAASRIDRHNRCRQDDLDIEKSVEVRGWSFRVNSTLLSICVVDAWLLFSGAHVGRDAMKPFEFYATLAEELIDNVFDSVGLRASNKKRVTPSSPRKLVATSGAYEHLTPTKKRRQTADAKYTRFRLQRRCASCGHKSTYVCYSCEESGVERSSFCHSATGRECYAIHLQERHGRAHNE